MDMNNEEEVQTVTKALDLVLGGLKFAMFVFSDNDRIDLFSNASSGPELKMLLESALKQA